jgi:alpha-ribazole phosphatase
VRLYLIRHAPPEIASGICYGSTDLSVSEADQRAVLSALIPVLPMNLPVFSSPLRRCRELAASLASALASNQVLYDSRLAEMHFGAWEMRAWDDIPRAEIDAWAGNPHSYRPGGGESVLEVEQRVRSFLDQVQEQKLSGAIVVCHAGTIRMLSACRAHASPMDAALDAAGTQHAIAYGQVIALDC